MNDTEAEARRLLAAATEDMPPGVDLPGRFAGARRRDRARRTRRRALSAGVAAAAASVTVAALTTGSAPPALATVTTALTRTLARSYHLTEQDSSYYTRDGRHTNRVHYECTSETDPVRHLGASSCSNGLASREVGKYAYLYFAHPADHPGKHWWRTPSASRGRAHVHAVNGVTAATPQQMLSQVKKACKVTVTGPVAGPGWTGTRYAFTSRPASGPGARIKLSGTVDVDRQGRARELVFTMRLTTQVNVLVMRQVLMFSDFGARVRVTPPPADQTFSSMP